MAVRPGERSGERTPARASPRTPGRRRTPLARVRDGAFALVLSVVAAYFGACFGLMAAYKIVYPPTTGVQIERRVEALVSGEDYTKRYDPEPMDRIARHLPHAVVAAEDGRFYTHGGIDFEALQEARRQAERRGSAMRGASTISQQLVKNLFLTTDRSLVRKAAEVPLTYAAEAILGKERILDLYVNVIEWGPGVYGAEAAAQHHYGKAAARLSRRESATLAALVPAPLARTPRTVAWYRRLIERRMRAMGW